jgi:hypothetical protein
MSDQKTCPRCKGAMVAGSLKEIGHHGNSPYEWVPQDDPSFAVKGLPTKRRALVAHRCEGCGYVELSAP